VWAMVQLQYEMYLAALTERTSRAPSSDDTCCQDSCASNQRWRGPAGGSLLIRLQDELPGKCKPARPPAVLKWKGVNWFQPVCKLRV
jgi:hypothetical protein